MTFKMVKVNIIIRLIKVGDMPINFILIYKTILWSLGVIYWTCSWKKTSKFMDCISLKLFTYFIRYIN